MTVGELRGALASVPAELDGKTVILIVDELPAPLVFVTIAEEEGSDGRSYVSLVLSDDTGGAS